MNERERNALREAALTTYRRRDAEGRLLPPAAWWDLPPEALEELYAEQFAARDVERALHPQGWSGTVAAVMRRIV